MATDVVERIDSYAFDARSMKEQRDALAWATAEQELVELRRMVRRLLSELRQEVGA